MFCFSDKKPQGKWRISLTKQNNKKKGKWKPLSPHCTYLETGENVTDHGPQDRTCI